MMHHAAVAWAALLLVEGAPPLAAQEADSLEAAVERARLAWLAHDVRGLVASSDTMRLRVPGVAMNHSMRPGQAARLLEQYLEASVEEGMDLREIRPVGEGHAYAEFERHHVVRGTDDRRAETVFFGFRQVEGRWRLREVRIAP